MTFDGASVLLQWAVGGLAFLWVTTRRRVVSLGYGWLLRSVWGLIAVGALVIGLRSDPEPVREVSTGLVVLAAAVALAVSVFRRRDGLGGFAPALDLVAPLVGLVGLVAAGIDDGDPAALGVARILAGAAFLGSITDAMLLGHWYLVQPGLSRAPLLELVRDAGVTWLPEVLVLLWPVGMVSVLNGSIDDGYGGILGWFWVMCVVTTIALVVLTRAALREKQYSAVMAATGLLYLAILTAAGTDLVARAVLST